MATVPRRVQCPRCGDHLTVIPIVYGSPAPQQRELLNAGLLVMGGQPMYEDGRDPTHFCSGCKVSFRPGQAAVSDPEPDGS